MESAQGVSAERGAPRREREPSAAGWRLPVPLWGGMPLGAWLRLLWRGRFGVRPDRWALLPLNAVSALGSSLSEGLTRLAQWRRLSRQPVVAPLFIVGHWRSGTTLLHELLALDPRHVWPDGFDCFTPTSAGWMRRLFGRLVRRFQPGNRPMDAMRFDMHGPQEDEFGLMLLGAPSPYESFAFPARPNRRGDPALLTARERARFARVAHRFFRRVLLRRPEGRLLLKSPPHMARLPQLQALYPDLKVVHIVRDPRAVLPSMERMLPILAGQFALGRLPPADPAHALRGHGLMFERFWQDSAGLPPGSLVEIRYEDLVADPVGVLRDLYARLGLGDVEDLARRVGQRVAEGAFHPARLPALPPDQRALLERSCAAVLRRYGYR